MLTDTTEGRILARWIAEKGLEPYLPPIVLRLLGLANQLSRYTVVSAMALGLDFTVYLALAGGAYRAAFAGIVAYAVGMLLHFSLSTRYVFKRRSVSKSDARLFTEFLISGVAGLAITAVVIAIMTDGLGFSALAGKVCAVVLSFMAVFVLRRSVVFSSRNAAA